MSVIRYSAQHYDELHLQVYWADAASAALVVGVVLRHRAAAAVYLTEDAA